MEKINWHFPAIKIANKNIYPSKDWIDLIELLKDSDLVENKVLGKIEVASFAIRGSRLLRWRIREDDPEYSSEEECLKIAKKLLVYFLQINDLNKEIPKEIKNTLEIDENAEPTKCPLCLLEIEKEQFLIDARIHPKAIQMGHLNPLNLRDENNSNHFAENINWQHRRCNYMQGEDTLDNALDFMIEILQRHKKI
ncbi:MAG: hypothetical protein ACKO7P_08735 [Bacteroidota bacterium]